MEEQINDLAQSAVEVVDIQFQPGQKIYYFDPAGKTYHTGDHVIIDTARGAEYGICAGGNHTIRAADVVSPLRPVLRLATAQDEKTVAENREKEKRAYEICLEKIESSQLDMQLVSAEYAFDGSRILFFFTADERVDFRELVKSLASIFHVRIELRQIGVRDKAKMVGGLGICGRPFCCISFLEDFQPVSIKMAKTQNLSLNPTKISGTCGRLMCCLKYEQEAYEDLIRTSPKLNSLVDTPEGRGTIVELDLLHQRVKVRLDNASEALHTFANTDIAVLRSGKAKKNDPPIPEDYAPVSGAQRQSVQKEPEEPVLLDPIFIRDEPETPMEDVQETAESIESEAAIEAKPVHRRRNRRGGNRPERKQSAPDAVQEVTAQKEASQAHDAAAPVKKHRRRPNYHRRKPKANTDAQ